MCNHEYINNLSINSENVTRIEINNVLRQSTNPVKCELITPEITPY